MTDQEQEQELAYLTEEALIVPPNFTSTMKRGYVEEEVDEWVKKIAATQEALVNSYNVTVYRTMNAEYQVAELTKENDELKTEVNTLTEQINGLTTQLAAAQDEANTAKTQLSDALNRVADLEAALAAAPVTDTDTYASTDYSYDEPVSEPEPTYDEPVYDEPVVETPVVETVSVSEKAQRILNEAAEEASQHVSRSLERVAAIEAEAEEEAQALVANAHVEATQILENAYNEAAELKAAAEEESARVVQTSEAARDYATKVFAKITAFHEFELANAQEIIALLKGAYAETEEEAAEDVEDLTVAEEVAEALEEAAVVEEAEEILDELGNETAEEVSYDAVDTVEDNPVVVEEYVEEVVAVEDAPAEEYSVESFEVVEEDVLPVVTEEVYEEAPVEVESYELSVEEGDGEELVDYTALLTEEAEPAEENGNADDSGDAERYNY